VAAEYEKPASGGNSSTCESGKIGATPGCEPRHGQFLRRTGRNHPVGLCSFGQQELPAANTDTQETENLESQVSLRVHRHRGTFKNPTPWPNPSVEARPNGKPPGPGRWHVYIFTGPGLASCRRPRLTSNVRPRTKPMQSSKRQGPPFLPSALLTAAMPSSNSAPSSNLSAIEREHPSMHFSRKRPIWKHVQGRLQLLPGIAGLRGAQSTEHREGQFVVPPPGENFWLPLACHAAAQRQ